MQTVKVDVLVVGAGPTGLGAAIRLEELGQDSWLLCEQSTKYFDSVLEASVGKFTEKEAWVCLERECYIRYSNNWVPYPFQNNLYCIPKQDQVDCLLGLVQAKLDAATRPVGIKPRNFDEWIVQTMGQGLARVFMRPYNFKVWATPCELMSSTWLGERVSVVDYTKAITNTILETRDAAWGPNAVFRFPKLAGGTGGIWQAVADKLLPRSKLEYNTQLVEVDLDNKIASFANGKQVKYRNLVSTIPLDLLLDLAKKNSEESKSLLVHSSTNVLGFGIRGENPHGSKCWLYFPEPNCPFYRATVFSNYSPNNTPSANVLLPTLRLAGGDGEKLVNDPQPGPYWSVMLEVSESSTHKPVDQAAIVSDCLRGCIEAGLLQVEDEVVSIYHKRLEHGYPTPSLRRDEILGKLLPELQHKHQVWSRGRFGSWKYEVGNQDHSLILGVEAVDSIFNSQAGGGEEETLCKPNLVNSRGKNPTPRYMGKWFGFQVGKDKFKTKVPKLVGQRFATVEDYIRFLT
ncbi:hypothetical protein BASA81_000270 [Batrachochytrium salamandrivorans]|nr:hypothetical protein BASA81_000270 [Batrachochytrium salamandrivorans]